MNKVSLMCLASILLYAHYVYANTSLEIQPTMVQRGRTAYLAPTLTYKPTEKVCLTATYGGYGLDQEFQQSAKVKLSFKF